jgi:hypothetical protein
MSCHVVTVDMNATVALEFDAVKLDGEFDDYCYHYYCYYCHLFVLVIYRFD